MPQITDNVSFDTVAREWRLKWSDDEEKLSLTQVQEVLDSMNTDIAAVAGVRNVQRIVCGGCHDFKVVIALPENKFDAWKEAGFAPEATFLDAVKKIGGVSQVETQTYTLSSVHLKRPVETRRDPTDPFSTKRYARTEFVKFYGPQEGARIWQQAAGAEKQAAKRLEKSRNHAFVFIKPHAVTDAVKKLVADNLKARGIKITKQGAVKSEIIDKKKLIDQHYYAIASKATILKPKELNVPADKFKEKFGLSWEDALAKGEVYNAMDACEKLGVDADGLDKLWAASKKAGKMIKFGGGFYCGIVEAEGKAPIYAFNGFFMSMRSKFTVPGECIYYYNVSWDPKELSWSDFRNKVLGPTDPKDAPADSLRGIVMKDWKDLGLKAEPNVGDNGVHASASPFEGLSERMNWGRADATEDPFGRLLLESGVKLGDIKRWSVDPQVNLDADGKKGSLFDALEDMDSAECVSRAVELWKLNKPERPPRKEKAAKPATLVKE